MRMLHPWLVDRFFQELAVRAPPCLVHRLPHNERHAVSIDRAAMLCSLLPSGESIKMPRRRLLGATGWRRCCGPWSAWDGPAGAEHQSSVQGSSDPSPSDRVADRGQRAHKQIRADSDKLTHPTARPQRQRRLTTEVGLLSIGLLPLTVREPGEMALRSLSPSFSWRPSW